MSSMYIYIYIYTERERERYGQAIVAIFYPFSQFCEIKISPPEPAKTAKHSPKSISKGGRIWQV